MHDVIRFCLEQSLVQRTALPLHRRAGRPSSIEPCDRKDAGRGYNTVVSTQPEQHMQCMEVWGGSQLTSAGVEMGGLNVWVYQQALRRGTARRRRLLRFELCHRPDFPPPAGRRLRTRNSVAATAADLRTLMRRFVNRLDQAEFVRLLNQQFIALSQSATFATAVVTTFFAPTRRLTVCNAGHPRPFIYRAAKRQWDFLGHERRIGTKKSKPQNIPLGLLALAEYEQVDVELDPGDCLLKYTDALIESSDADGEMLGEDGLLRIMRLIGDVQPEKVIETVLNEIEDRYPENLAKDDVTLMLVRASGLQPQHPFLEKIKARLRFAGVAASWLESLGRARSAPRLQSGEHGRRDRSRPWLAAGAPKARGTGRRAPDPMPYHVSCFHHGASPAGRPLVPAPFKRRLARIERFESVFRKPVRSR